MSTSEQTHRILLLNFTQTDVEVLRKAKFNAEIGYLGTGIRVSGKEEVHVQYQFPRPLYEYEISVYNSVLTDDTAKPFNGIRTIPLGDRMLEPFLQWQRQTRPSLRIAFIGDSQGVKSLVFAGLPFLVLSPADEGVSLLEVPESPSGIREITKLIASFRRRVKIPVGQYVAWSGHFQQYPYTHVPVILNRNGDEIASYGTRYSGETIPLYVVLPQMQSNVGVLVELLDQIARLRPGLFPDREMRDWYNSPEFAFAEEKAINTAIEDRIQKTKQFVEAKLFEKEEVVRRFGFIKEILISREDLTTDPDHRLSFGVRKVLEFLGFVVEDIDAKVKGVIRKEDFWVRDGDDFVAITEVTGVNAKNPKTKEFNDLLGRMATIFKRRDLIPDASQITGLLVVNYDLNTHPAKRPHLYGGEGQEIVEAAKANDIGLLATQELYKIAIAVKDGVMTKEDARALIRETGRIEYKPVPPAGQGTLTP